MEQKENLKPCDCKGRRTCLLCEKLLNKVPRDFFKEFQVNFFLLLNYTEDFLTNIFTFRAWIRLFSAYTATKFFPGGMSSIAVKTTRL